MSPLNDRFIAFYNILGGAALSVALVGCSSDEPVVPPVPGGNSGCEIGYNLTVSGEQESRCVGDTENKHSYEFTTDNFTANNPMVQMRMEFNSGGYQSFPSTWCVNLPELGYRTAVQASGDGNSYNVGNFAHSPNYWKPSVPIYVYALAGHTNCTFGEGMPNFTEVAGTGSLGNRLYVGQFTQWGYHPVDFLFGYGTATKTYNEYRADPKIHVTFNHAMSKLTFSIENVNPNINIWVRNIRIGNINCTGSFNYSQAMALMGWNVNDIKAITAANVGSVWSNLSNPMVLTVTEPRAKMGEFNLANGENKTPWTAFGAPFFFTVIPQKVAKWTRDAKDRPCLILDCTITDTANGKVIWSSDGSNGIYLPLTTGTETEQVFLPGRHYHYHIKFPNNTDWNDGGWDSGGNPVLVPVGITAAVGDWIGEDRGHWNPNWWR